MKAIPAIAWTIFLATLVLVGLVACQLATTTPRSTTAASASSVDQPMAADAKPEASTSAGQAVVWGEVPKQCA